MAKIQLWPGDVLLVRSNGFVAKCIRYVSQSQSEKPTRVNHAQISVAGLSMLQLKAGLPNHYDVVPKLGIQDLIVDAQPPTVTLESLWERYGPEGTRDEVAIYRMKDLTMEERVSIAMRSLRYVGDRYGFTKILLHLLHLRKFCFIEGRPICSYIPAMCYDEMKDVLFGCAPNTAQPDDLDDYLEEHKTKDWTCVHELGPLEE